MFDVTETETAWGDGYRFNEKGNWGMWFSYEWVCFADLELIKTIDTEPPYAIGDEITWNVTVVNKGPDPAINVIVKDYPPEGGLVSIISFECSHGSFDSTVAEWDIGDLGLEESAQLTIVTEILERGTIIDSAEVYACDSIDLDSTPGNYDPADPVATDEDDSDSASIIFFPEAGNAYIGYEDRQNGDFDYNDFGMNMELTEVYKNNCLASIDMKFTSVAHKAGDSHDIHIERLFDEETYYDYQISRTTAASGTETSAGSYTGQGDFDIILFDSHSYSYEDVVTIHIDITSGCEEFTIPTAPRWDLDPVFALYNPYMFDRTVTVTRNIGDWQAFTGIQVPYILVVPYEDWPAPGEGVTITTVYDKFDDYYSTQDSAYADWYIPWYTQIAFFFNKNWKFHAYSTSLAQAHSRTVYKAYDKFSSAWEQSSIQVIA